MFYIPAFFSVLFWIGDLEARHVGFSAVGSLVAIVQWQSAHICTIEKHTLRIWGRNWGSAWKSVSSHLCILHIPMFLGWFNVLNG
jgi:hypothetical protein